MRTITVFETPDELLNAANPPQGYVGPTLPPTVQIVLSNNDAGPSLTGAGAEGFAVVGFTNAQLIGTGAKRLGLSLYGF